jgi:DNA-binding response OmpR family regulator
MSRVLLIEDSLPLSRIIDWILTEAGHEVTAVTTPEESPGLAGRQQPHVVVFNTGMPDTEKLSYVDDIRRAAPHARIIDLAPDAARRRLRAEARGEAGGCAWQVDCFLAVPFHADDLLKAIDELTVEE